MCYLLRLHLRLFFLSCSQTKTLWIHSIACPNQSYVVPEQDNKKLKVVDAVAVVSEDQIIEEPDGSEDESDSDELVEEETSMDKEEDLLCCHEGTGLDGVRHLPS